MGWFEHGSTIIVVAPPGVSQCEEVHEGGRIQMRRALMRIDRSEARLEPLVTASKP
jgi:phosphatidylserine decarboxylase